MYVSDCMYYYLVIVCVAIVVVVVDILQMHGRVLPLASGMQVSSDVIKVYTNTKNYRLSTVLFSSISRIRRFTQLRYLFDYLFEMQTFNFVLQLQVLIRRCNIKCEIDFA